AWLNLRTPPAGWDALSYHLEFPAQWIAAGRMQWNTTVAGDQSPPYYPMLAEYFYTYFLLAGGHSFSAQLFQVFWAIVLYAAVRECGYTLLNFRFQIINSTEPATNSPQPLARRLPGNTNTLFIIIELFALVTLLLPHVQSSILTADNDVMLAAWTGMALLFFIRLLTRRYQNFSATSGGLTGALVIMACVKYTGAAYAAALALFAIALLIIRRPADAKRVGTLLSLLVIALLWILYFPLQWYGRNLLLTGSPIYPGGLAVPFFPDLFAGYYPAGFFDNHPFAGFNTTAFLLNPGYAGVWLLCLSTGVLFLVHGGSGSMLRRIKSLTTSEFRPVLVLLLMGVVLCLVYRYVIPFHQPRLALPAIVVVTMGLLGLFISRTPIVTGQNLQNHGMLSSVLPPLIPALVALVQTLINLGRLREHYGVLLNPSVLISDFSAQALHFIPDLWRFDGVSYLPAMLILTAILLIYLLYAHRLRKATRRILNITLLSMLCLCMLIGLLQSANATYREDRDITAAWNYINSNAPPDSALGIMGSNAPFALRGIHVQRPVYMLANFADEHRPLHARSSRIEFIPDAGADTAEENISVENGNNENATKGHWQETGIYPEPEGFIQNIHNLKLEYVLLTRSASGFWRPEREWLIDQRIIDQNWQRVFVKPNAEIWKRVGSAAKAKDPA
ncbi:MAG: hypothetical protein KDK30_04570, partial [Leptospiraceae bacterium]|nr:hypothetical protein [Leptospiraceae bacterium]